MTPRPILCFLLLLWAAAPLRADLAQSIGDWDAVTVAPMKTSIYIGSVTLTTGQFRRDREVYTTTYAAKVWPWFFWSETGFINIGLSENELARLSKGERVEFTGLGINHKNKFRKVTGRAERVDGTSGKIKVRIGVDDTELVFNGTYRFNNAVK